MIYRMYSLIRPLRVYALPPLLPPSSYIGIYISLVYTPPNYTQDSVYYGECVVAYVVTTQTHSY